MHEMKLAELAERSGVAARTIRLYISQGLLPGPLRAGRDAAYGEEHLARLEQIRELQRQGLTLAEIRLQVAPGEERRALPQPTAWLAFAIGDDVVVQVKRDTDPWRMRRILAALEDMAETLE